MSTITVTSRGEIALRKALLDHLGVKAGEEVSVDQLPGGRIEVKAASRAGKMSDLFGILASEGQPAVSLDEIKLAVEEGWAGER